MATVADCINEFLDRINQPREAAYVGVGTPAARQYISLFRFVAEELLDYQDGWDQLKRTYTFTSETGVSNYQLPGDWLRMLPGAQWGVTNQIPLAGPLSNERLAFQTYGVDIATPFAGYQVNGAPGSLTPAGSVSQGLIQLSPPGQDDTTEYVLTYVSCNYVWPTYWLATTAYGEGDVVTGVNNIYQCTQAGTSGTTVLSGTGTITDGSCEWEVYSGVYGLAGNGPSADTDILILDPALFVEGMRWAWYESKQQFEMANRLEAKWRDAVRTALGRQNGAVIISAAYDANSTLNWPVCPQTGWGTGDV